MLMVNDAIWKPRSRQIDRRKTLNLHKRPISLLQVIPESRHLKIVTKQCNRHML